MYSESQQLIRWIYEIEHLQERKLKGWIEIRCLLEGGRGRDEKFSPQLFTSVILALDVVETVIQGLLGTT